jgi:hypothetical protein
MLVESKFGYSCRQRFGHDYPQYEHYGSLFGRDLPGRANNFLRLVVAYWRTAVGRRWEESELVKQESALAGPVLLRASGRHCGRDGMRGGSPKPKTGGTPPGAYAITVIATAGATQHSATTTLAVQ